MKVLTIDDIRSIIGQIGIKAFLTRAIDALEEDLSDWERFLKSPRHATHFPHGVIELMPCSDEDLYSFKYVNGHPRNTREGKLSVVAVGMLASCADGYPILLADMTLLTAVRTAALTALGARYLARNDTSRLAIIGTGAQSEFQVLATSLTRPINTVRFFDSDAQAMKKFANNMKGFGLTLEPCNSVADAVDQSDMVITMTAAKHKAALLTSAMVMPGMHIHSLGGDCPGKTELDPALLPRCKIFVEYFEQCRIEGEIQNTPDLEGCTELWELVTSRKAGRETSREITLLDSVGVAVQDHSIIRLVYQLSEQLGMGESLALIPELTDPKNLFGMLVDTR